MGEVNSVPVIITAGSNYLDIDAYACSVAMQELFLLKGRKAIAYSDAPVNYSVCEFLTKPGQMQPVFPAEFNPDDVEYVIVDVSDPSYIENSVPLDRITTVYDHHVGFEDYWKERIGNDAHIEFVGAAATLVFREWKKVNLQEKMTRSTALLLIAAVLDNTLNLTSGNTTKEDIETFNKLCTIAGVGVEWCAEYFKNVQKNIEADLKNSLLKDVKHISQRIDLPEYVAQIAVWDARKTIGAFDDIREWFNERWQNWMLNIIDIKHCKCFFVCDDPYYQNKLSKKFNVPFIGGIAELSQPYLRKEIIKRFKD